jgi:hypothetical protein
MVTLKWLLPIFERLDRGSKCGGSIRKCAAAPWGSEARFNSFRECGFNTILEQLEPVASLRPLPDSRSLSANSLYTFA